MNPTWNPEALIQLTREVASCAHCPADFGNGDGVLREVEVDGRSYWIPPRGWAGAAEAGHRPILVAALNPGSPSPQEPVELYDLGARRPEPGDKVTERTAQALLDYCTADFLTPGRTRHFVFHRRTVAFIRMALWLLVDCGAQDPDIDPLTDDWRRFAWITDVYKCSTRRERGPKIPGPLLRHCVDHHLAREIELFRPRVVIALGNRAAEALGRVGVHHTKVLHPSSNFPRLDSPSHDRSLADLAERIGHPEGTAVAAAPRFRAFRSDLQNALFG